MADAPAEQATERSRAKADRRDALLTAAARLFAARGFNGVSIEDLGSAVGISGPAVYRHFSGKQAVLAALLVGVSEDLLAGGLAVVDAAANDTAALRALIRFHTDFALSNPEVIRVQDRDLESLADEDSHAVRTLQRRYVELWVGVLARRNPREDTAVLRMRAHATFGLLNSTPHSSSRSLPRATMHDELEKMAWALLG
ncbi:TetR/AcrR family transcriptional regulator [Lacisediminihabitans sp.]|jgi:AcrR family transcriptional regulator|uniref:SACE_7040 family transcriptional regulator n=1 Tax=Lacisediminihabitans sp. TaxID=2787631 RepID=UPI002F920EEF